MRAVPGSTTYRIPGTVSDVSATLVANTIRGPWWAANTFCCSAVGSRAYSGNTSTSGPTAPRKASAVSRISRSPARNTNTSPAGSLSNSATASTI